VPGRTASPRDRHRATGPNTAATVDSRAVRAGPRLTVVALLAAALGAACGTSSSSTRPTASTVAPGATEPGATALATAAAAAASTCAGTATGTSPRDVAAASAAARDGVLCLPAGTYEGVMFAREANQTWRFAPDAVIAGRLVIAAPGVTIEGGRVEVATDDPWEPSIVIAADDAVVERVTFVTGGLGISIKGVDGARIVGNTFSGLIGTAIFVWGDGRGADGVTIEQNSITQGQARRASPVSSRGSDDSSVTNTNLIVRGNMIDQGTPETGWFGIELKATPGAIVEANEVRGGSVLISLPDSDGTVIRGNLLDMRGSPHWGVEIASSDGVQVVDNEFQGRGRDAGQTAVSMNSGSRGALIQGNRVTAVSTLVDLTGDAHRVVANCLVDVARQYDYRSSAGRDLVFEDNGAC